MAALTENRITKGSFLGPIRRYKMAVSTTLFSHSIVMLNASGLVVPASAIANNQGCVGMANEKIISPASGATFILVQEGTFLWAASTIADTSVGLTVYAEDDQTIDETQDANQPVAGRLYAVESASSAWVKMELGLNA